ncbi:ComF family protein [Pseudolysinimonas kribbensis]|uniref:Phosphoribosyltransferase domain-containing protein n=1 Tax=Pseudolysinimonas kribbensis TaxID=433641 RepID=A0ABQ6K5X8_9MICO|nr:phosphoribosyltransferase family protein [Pseudolysinimonas kribbensis]GMA94191.1 hypothetical protein GCM10025881_10150 [Pseudolysinimonas kribbensis]
MPETPLRAALLDAAALLLPVVCAGCGADDRALCGACIAALAPVPRRRVLADGTAVLAGLGYEGIAREVIVAMKSDRPGLAGRLAPALIAAVAAARAEAVEGGAADGVLELCAVPSTRRARRRRGYDPVRRTLAAAGFRVAPVFRAARPHPAQKTLSATARGSHLAGVFVARGPLDGRRFLLVDDVVTTGATLMAAADALREAGAQVLAYAAIASTPRRVAGFGGDAATTHRNPSGPAG